MLKGRAEKISHHRGRVALNPTHDSGETRDRMTDKGMKYLILVVLLCLAAVEYWHHRMDGHSHGAPAATAASATPEAKKEAARELYRQHMRGH